MSKARDRKYKEYRERQEDARVRAEAKSALQSLATYEQMVNPAKGTTNHLNPDVIAPYEKTDSKGRHYLWIYGEGHHGGNYYDHSFALYDNGAPVWQVVHDNYIETRMRH